MMIESVSILAENVSCSVKYCKVHLYADDTLLYFESNSVQTIETVLFKDLKHIVGWLNQNYLLLNGHNRIHVNKFFAEVKKITLEETRKNQEKASQPSMHLYI